MYGNAVNAAKLSIRKILKNKVMKANAPEKLYLLSNGLISYCRNNENDIEYIRIDAFIEKAVDYIANNMRCDGYTLQTKMKFIEGFKNFMKGE